MRKLIVIVAMSLSMTACCNTSQDVQVAYLSNDGKIAQAFGRSFGTEHIARRGLTDKTNFLLYDDCQNVILRIDPSKVKDISFESGLKN